MKAGLYQIKAGLYQIKTAKTLSRSWRINIKLDCIGFRISSIDNGNEIADELVKLGSNSSNLDSIESVEPPTRFKLLSEWVVRRANWLWDLREEYSVSQAIYLRLDAAKTKLLLGLVRKALRVLLSVIPGHYAIWARTSRWVTTTLDFFRICEDAYVEHILCYWSVLQDR